MRFAPSPTGSLHLGNALTAVANRRFADEHGGALVLRIDDTDPSQDGRGRRGRDPRRPRLARRRRSTRAPCARASEVRCTRQAAERALDSGAAERDDDGAVRLVRGGTTLVRPDGTRDVSARLGRRRPRARDHARHSRERPSPEPRGAAADRARARGRASGGDPPRARARAGREEALEAPRTLVDRDLREEGFPPQAVRAYLDELGLPEHDVQLDLARLRRLAVDAIAAMPDEELAAAAGAPIEVVPCCAARGHWSRRGRTRELVTRAAAASQLPPEAHADARAIRRASRGRSGATLDMDEARALDPRAEGRRRGPARAPPCADRGGDRARARSRPRGGSSRDEALARAERAVGG